MCLLLDVLVNSTGTSTITVTVTMPLSEQRMGTTTLSQSLSAVWKACDQLNFGIYYDQAVIGHTVTVTVTVTVTGY